MDKKQAVIAHRKALAEYENARSKHRRCVKKNSCGDKECVTCPVFQTKQNALALLQEKAQVLQDINNRIIAGNDALQNRRIQARIEKREQRMQKKGGSKVAKKTFTVNQYKELVAKGLNMTEIAHTLGVSQATLYARKAEWTEKGLLETKNKPNKVQRSAQKTTVPAAPTPVITPSASQAPEVNYEALYKKMLENFNAQQAELKAEVEHNQALQEKARAYEQHAEELEEQLLTEREEIARLRAHNKHLKHAQHASDVSKQENTRINQLELEIAEMAEEVSNACYEKAEIERKYDRLARMAAPILKDWTEALLKEVNG